MSGNRSAARAVAACVAAIALGLLAAACGQSTLELPPEVVVADGFALEVVAIGLDKPTQMARTPAGDIVVGELAGGENDASGRIVLIDGDDFGERTTLVGGLDKPTGVAVIGDALWVMQRASLWVGRFDGSASVELSPVLVDLPSNGRSQGTLTVTPDGGLLYNTSGSKRGSERVEGSGSIFVIEDPTLTPSDPEVVATGFKHAYAHLYAANGELWSIEMTDGNFDGARAADEIVQVRSGDDAGWPFCVGDNRPVVEFGGSPSLCADSPRSHAVFDPGSTPTSLAVPPWSSDVLLTTLWLTGDVVSVPTSDADAPHAPTIVVDGIESPQSLLVDGDSVLITDHETGTLFALSPD